MDNQKVVDVPFRMIGFIVLIVVTAIIAWIVWPLHTVPTGSRGVVTVGGAIRGIEPEGFIMLAPWQHLAIFNIRAEQADVKDAEAATADTQPVTVSLTVRYSISIDKVALVYEKYSHDGNLDSYITTATQDVFKAVTAKYTAPDLISKRSEVASTISDALQKKVAQYGANIINVDMTAFRFAQKYMDAINEKVTQEQLQLAAEKELLTVQSRQKQKVAVAEAEANAVKAHADGQSYANLKVAQAQADAIKVQGAALAANPQVLELRRIEMQVKQVGQGWNGVLPTHIYGSAPIPFVPGSMAVAK